MIDLHYNKLSGILPTLSSADITYISFAGNSFTGTILAEIGELATLGADLAPAALAALQTKLEALQVFRLGPAEVKDVLSNLQVDD